MAKLFEIVSMGDFFNRDKHAAYVTIPEEYTIAKKCEYTRFIRFDLTEEGEEYLKEKLGKDYFTYGRMIQEAEEKKVIKYMQEQFAIYRKFLREYKEIKQNTDLNIDIDL